MKTGNLLDQALTASLPMFTDANKQLVTKSVADTRTALNVGRPAFSAFLSSTIADVTGDNTAYTILFDTEIFDNASDYAPVTGIFTAPVTGKYQLTTNLLLVGLTTSHTTIRVYIVTTNRTYYFYDYLSLAVSRGIPLNVLADMDAGETAYVVVRISGGTKVVDVYGEATDPCSSFSGYLVI
jgi:hypothetical protein